jgi:uncharacterized protein (DUF342 family)
MSSGQPPEHPVPASAVDSPTQDTEGTTDGIQLRMTKDRMQVVLECDAAGRAPESLAQCIFDRLERFKLVKPPDPARLAETLREALERSDDLRGLCVASGTPPRQPVDGRIVWSADYFNPGFEVDNDTGRINFRRRIGNRNVAEGQLLATIVQPVKGENGIDLLGNVVRVRQPRRSRIRVGENVEADSEGLNFFATLTGRIRWHRELLSVDEVYEIDGDLGLETGDVSHHGAVLVHGDVLQGSRLEAVGDVEVLGTIEGAHVQTGGALHVHGGITGNDHTRIVAAGGIQARFILDAHIQAGGDVTVENEVIHANISTRGALYVPAGRLVGGEINALGGVDAGQLGSPAAVPTHIIAGEDHTLEGQIAILRNKLRLAVENVEKVNNTLVPLRGKIASLPEKSKDALRTLLGNLPAMEAAVEELKEEIAEVTAQSHAQSRDVILVRNRLYPDVRLRIHGETLHVREETHGPVRPILVEGHVRLAPTHMQRIGEPPEPHLDIPTGHAEP